MASAMRFTTTELFFFSSRRRHTRYIGDWSSDVCSSDLNRTPKRLIFALLLILDGKDARDESSRHAIGQSAPQSAALLARGGGTGHKLRWEICLCRPLHRHLLPAVVPVAPASASTGAVLRRAGDRRAKWLPPLPPVPAAQCGAQPASRTGRAALPVHRGASRWRASAGVAGCPSRPEPAPLATNLPARDGNFAAAIRRRIALAPAEKTIAQRRRRDYSTLRSGIRLLKPALRTLGRAARNDAGDLPPRRARHAHRLHDCELLARAAAGGRDPARSFRCLSGRFEWATRSGAARGVP